MPRRRASGLEGLFVGVALVCGFFVWLFTEIRDSIGFVMPTVFIVAMIVLMIVLKAKRRKKRLQYLADKYGDPQIADHIYNHRFWQGQTTDQLIESLGNPHGVDRKLLKTMKREVWKYNPRGVNRYALRITLDNDVVSTWDQKQ